MNIFDDNACAENQDMAAIMIGYSSVAGDWKSYSW
jgi:hypothetical protein